MIIYNGAKLSSETYFGYKKASCNLKFSCVKVRISLDQD